MTHASQELFGLRAEAPLEIGELTLLLYAGVFCVGFFWGDKAMEDERAKRKSFVILGLVFSLLYFLLPNSLTIGMGGFWKTRLVFLPPLFFLSCSGQCNVKVLRVFLC